MTAAETAIVTAVPPAPAAAPAGGRPKTAAALAKAQKAVGRVAHDARNEFHRYEYTSAEALIEAGKNALADNGLALLPVEETLDGWERTGENRFQLICRFLLVHESGEAVPLVRHWPVCPEKGRPLDKATAAAATLALAYLLRDLLLMPRVSPADDPSGRDDRRADRPGRPAKPTRDLPADGAELLRRLTDYDRRLAAAGVSGTGGLLAHVRAAGAAAGLVEDMTRWAGPAIALAVRATREFEAAARQQAAAPTAGMNPAVGAGAAGAVGAPPPPELANPAQCRAIWHQARLSPYRTAVALLATLGVRVPDEFTEPTSDGEAEQMAHWLRQSDALDALLKLAQATRPPAPK